VKKLIAWIVGLLVAVVTSLGYPDVAMLIAGIRAAR